MQRTIAQVTTRKISELERLVWVDDVDNDEDEDDDDEAEKTPLLSAMEEIRKPISPRAVMAQPRIEAGYRDRGLASAGVVCEVVPIAGV